MTELAHIPLFPLKTVLFPGGPLPLRIFEHRYLDMVSRCTREGQGFGVVLILEGAEAVTPVLTHRVGTLARIVDFYQLDDGLLGITALGEKRFRLRESRRQPDGLNVGTVEWLTDGQAVPLPAAFELHARLLEQALSQLGGLYAQLERHFDDAMWVGARLLEILPLKLEDKQHCLELDDPLERLEFLKPLVRTNRR